MAQTALPSLEQLLTPDNGPDHPLERFLDLVFEPSDTIRTALPMLQASIMEHAPKTHLDVIEAFASIVHGLPTEARAPLLTAHPAIGEKKPLSALSATEQRSGDAIDPAVQARLTRLNQIYELRYPPLRYVTFVNGRTKVQIAEEMEDMLDVHDDGIGDYVTYAMGSEEWQRELDRGIDAVMAIAKDRTKKLLAQSA